MVNIIKKFILIVFLCLPGLIMSQSSIILNFNEAWEMVEKQNPDYFETQYALSLAAKAAETYLDTFIPQISANISTGRNSNIYTEDNTSEGERWNFSGGIDTRLTLSTSKKYIQKHEVLQYRLLKITAALQKQGLYTDLYRLWLRLLFVYEETEILRGDLVNAEKRLEQVQKKYSNGLVSEREVLSARLSVARIKPDIEKQLAQIKRYHLDLKYLLGLSPEDEVELSEAKPPEPLNDRELPSFIELKNIIPGSLYLKRAYLQSEIRALDLSETITVNQGIMPTAGVIMGFNWNSSLNDIISGSAFEENQFKDKLSFSLGIDIPLSSFIPGSSGFKKVEEAEDNFDFSKRNIKNTLTRQLNQLENILLDINLSRTNKELNVLSLELQRQNYEASRRSYQAGSISLLELEEALQRLRDAELSYRQQELDYLFLLVDLKNLLATE